MTPSIKITYFPVPGRAEPIRLTLYIGGIDFEDERITDEEFAALKAEGKIPFLMVPTMTADGEVYAESGAMLRYAGKLTSMYPTCAKDALKVDMVVDVLETIADALFIDVSEKGQNECLNNVFPRYFGALDKIYSGTAGTYLLGDTMSIADVKIMSFVSQINGGRRMEHIPSGCLDKYSNLMTVSKAVQEHEKVKEWYKTHETSEKGN